MNKVSPYLWNSSMSKLQEAYVEEFAKLAGDIKGRLAAQAYLNNSTARYHDVIIGMGYLPKLFDRPSLDALRVITTKTYGILDKMTRQYLEDPSYRALFRFSPLLEQMILLPRGYDHTVPISRIDIFLDENNGGFKFCEFNTDGTSAMNEDREVVNALANTPTFRNFSQSHDLTAQELFDPWVECFMNIYGSSDLFIQNPVVAIVDYLKSAVVDEQLEFRNRFEQHGITCLVCDVGTLEFVDGILYGRNVTKDHSMSEQPTRIDAIYRRAVTSELLQELQESLVADNLDSLRGPSGSSERGILQGAAALLAAVQERKVCLIGSFATQVAHSKASFCMLNRPETLEFLTQEERQFVEDHVPYTTWLKAESIDISMVKNTPWKWIIKPVDGYGTRGVHAGRSFDEAQWSKLIDEKLQEDYIIQEYCTQFQTLNTLPIPQDTMKQPLFLDESDARKLAEQELFKGTALEPFNVLTGLFCYGGTFGGVYVRAGQDALIAGFRGGVALGSVLVDYEPELHSLPRPRILPD